MSESDAWLGIKEVGRRDRGNNRGNDSRKRSATLLAQVKTSKQRRISISEKEGVTMEMGPLCISRGDREEEEWPSAAYRGHGQPGLVGTDVFPSQTLERGDLSISWGRKPPHLSLSCVSRAPSVLGEE